MSCNVVSGEDGKVAGPTNHPIPPPGVLNRIGFRSDLMRARLKTAKNNRLMKFSAEYGKNMVNPTWVCLMLTERCNSKCVHCDLWKCDASQEELTTEEWKATLEDLSRWLGPSIIVITGGEAFLRRDAMEIIGHACRLGLRPEILTNGLSTKRARCEELVKMQPFQITVSLAGVTP